MCALEPLENLYKSLTSLKVAVRVFQQSKMPKLQSAKISGALDVKYCQVPDISVTLQGLKELKVIATDTETDVSVSLLR